MRHHLGPNPVIFRLESMLIPEMDLKCLHSAMESYNAGQCVVGQRKSGESANEALLHSILDSAKRKGLPISMPRTKQALESKTLN